MKATLPQWLARVAGLAATCGALCLLCSDAIQSGVWGMEHILMPVIVGITILAGHLIGSAVRDWKPLSAFGFLGLFLIGTALTVYTSVGRQAAVADAQALATEGANAERSRIAAELGRAQAMVDEEQAALARECKTGKGKRCDGIKASVDVYIAAIKGHKADLEKLGPEEPVAPRADRFSEVVAITAGAEKRIVKHLVMVFEPFAYSLFLELTAIVALGYGFGYRRNCGNHDEVRNSRATVPATLATIANDDKLLAEKHGNRRVVSKAAAEADVMYLVASHDALPSQNSLAERWGCHKGTASKWLAEFERRGLVSRARFGRCKRVVSV